MFKESTRQLLRMYAGDPNDGGAGGAPTTTPAPATDPAGGQPSGNEPTGDPFKDHQAEFDRRVAKAIDTARAKWEEEHKDAVQTAVSEAERLAKMTADQREEHRRQQEAEKMAKREAEITRRELTATAKEQLAEANLPIGLAACLNYENADTCAASLDAVKKAFAAEVEKAVNDRLRSAPPKAGSDNKGLSGVEAAFAALNPNL